MSISAQSVARRVVAALNDDASVRWALSEVVRAINDAQRQIAIDRPDLLATTSTITLAAGTRQTLPANGLKLLAVNRNASGAAVRVVNRDMLDAQIPNWHAIPPSAAIRHYVFDAREPTVFHVFPPALSTAQLEVVYSAHPVLIAEPAHGASLPADHATDISAPAVVLGNLTVPDHLVVAVADFALARLLLKDSEAGSAQRAMAHFQSYANALGIDMKATLAAGPNSNSPFNPLRPAIATPG
jgi:hypothetical protein